MEEHESIWKSPIITTITWFIACVLLILAMLNTFVMVQDILKWIAASIDETTRRLDFEITGAGITQGMFFLGGCIAVGLAIGIEYYFRLGEKKGLLFKRVAKVYIILVATIIVTVLVRLIGGAVLF